jgi:hypothetical protein
MPNFMAAAVSALLFVPAAVRAEPVCALPGVLQVVSDELAARGVYAELDPAGVGERSAPGAATVLCAVKLLMPYYDTSRFGYARQYRMEMRSYQIRRWPHSLRVDLLD